MYATTHAAASKGEAQPDKSLPLEPTRELSFVTERGTWMSLDVSPDGSTIVFDLLGDLYTLPIEGGEAKRLTSGLAFDSQPAWSPDGKCITFVSDRDGAENVWIADADGSAPKKLSRDSQAEFASPTFSPEGDYVLVSRSTWGLRTYELWSYHVQGGSGVRITEAKADPKTPNAQRHNALGVVVSPDGRHIFYAMRRGGFSYNADFPMWQIARRDTLTGDEDVLTQATGSAFRPRLSPDGARLVFGTRHEAATGLKLRDLTSGAERWLVYPVERDEQESRFTRDLLPGYAFTPDGAALIVAYAGTFHRVEIDSGASTPIPFRSRVEQALGPRLDFPRRVETGPVRSRLIQGATPSPDGSRVAFSAFAKLHVAELPSAAPHRVTEADAAEFQPAWSPDGHWLAYVTWDGTSGALWKVAASGGAPVAVSRVPGFYTDPVWSPDGTRIVALRGPAEGRVRVENDFGQLPAMDLVWFPAAGGDARLVLPSRGVGRPHFTRDPERIYVYANPGAYAGGGPLISLRFDGTERREHITVTGPGLYSAEEPVPADDMRISPDGRWALARVRNQLYLVAVPRVSSPAPKVDVAAPSLPLKQLTNVGADNFDWTDDGRAIAWSVGSTFYRRPLSGVSFEDAEKDSPGGDENGKKRPRKAGKKDAPQEETEPFAEADPSVESFSIDVSRPRAAPAGTIALSGARVITMRGEEVLDDGVVLIEGNRIVAVGLREAVSVPDGARVFDLRGKTIVPGFIDTHAHWFEIRRGVLDLNNWSFLANLAYGVTAGLDVQTATNDMFAYQDLVDAGLLTGPRAYSTGPGIFSDNGFQSRQEVEGVLRRYRDHYGTRNVKSYIVGNREQRQWMVQAAHKLEMMPTTEGALDMKLDLTHVLDGFSGNEHTLPLVPLYDDVVKLVAESGIGYTPTLLVTYGGPFAENWFYVNEDAYGDEKLRRFTPREILAAKTRKVDWFREDQHVFPRIAEQAAKIARAGGRVGVGAHGQLQGLGYHWELWALARGMEPHEALRAATLHGAEIIGLAQDLGSVEPGKLADLVVLDADPLAGIRATNRIRYVMKNGELFDGATLDRVWPDPRPLPPLWWWSADPVAP